MSLIPTDNAETTDGGAAGLSALESALLAPGETPATEENPVAEETPAPVKEEAPAPVEDTPLKEIDKAAEDDMSKLPIDDLEEDVEEETADVATDKVGRRIEALKTEIKTTYKPRITELEQTLAERDARLLELKGSADELEKLRETVKSYETEMSVVKLERTPAFIKEVTEPFEAIQTKTDAIIEQYDLDSKAVYAAFAEPDEGKRRAAIKEATSGLELDVDDAVELRSLARDVQPLYTKRDELYANADKALAELGARSEQETAAQAQARAEERVKATDLVATRVTKALPFLKDILTDSLVSSIKETDQDALDPQNKVYNHLAGVTLPKLASQYSKLIAERDKLLDEIAGYQKSGARVGDGLGSAAPGEGKPKSLLEGLLAGVNG